MLHKRTGGEFKKNISHLGNHWGRAGSGTCYPEEPAVRILKGENVPRAPTLQTVTSYIEVLVTDQWSVASIAISNHRSIPFRLAIWKEGSFASPPNCDSEWIAKHIVLVEKAFLTHKNCLVHRNTVIL